VWFRSKSGVSQAEPAAEGNISSNSRPLLSSSGWQNHWQIIHWQVEIAMIVAQRLTDVRTIMTHDCADADNATAGHNGFEFGRTKLRLLYLHFFFFAHDRWSFHATMLQVTKLCIAVVFRRNFPLSTVTPDKCRKSTSIPSRRHKTYRIRDSLINTRSNANV
jgi:hypothetical protein